MKPLLIDCDNLRAVEIDEETHKRIRATYTRSKYIGNNEFDYDCNGDIVVNEITYKQILGAKNE
jgi:hypothetical protein